MKKSRSLRISEEIYKLLQAKKDELQKEKGKKITYNQLLEYLIAGNVPSGAGILLEKDVETRVKKYAEKHDISLNKAVNNLLTFAMELREEVYVVLTSDLKEEFKRLFSLLNRKEREKLKTDLKKSLLYIQGDFSKATQRR